MPISKKRRKELAATPDEQIDTSDIPELGPEFWQRAKVVLSEPKAVVTLRVDQDVVAWFKQAGKGYQSRMNAVLRSYMEHAGKTRAAVLSRKQR